MDRRAGSATDSLTEQYQTLLEVAEVISTKHNLPDLFRDLARRLPRVVPVNFVALSLHDPERQLMRLHTLQANVPADIIGGHEEPLDETPTGLVWHTQQPVIIRDIAEERRWPKVTGAHARGRHPVLVHHSPHHRGTPAWHDRLCKHRA